MSLIEKKTDSFLNFLYVLFILNNFYHYQKFILESTSTGTFVLAVAQTCSYIFKEAHFSYRITTVGLYVTL